MKTPIAYYGGKQKLISEILPLIPAHIQYGEPFYGGGSIFWAKNASAHEFINDIDLRVANFWQCLQTDYERLAQLIHHTLHHETIYQKAKEILQSPMIDRVEYAWAFWVQTQMSYSHKIFAGFAFNNTPNKTGLEQRRELICTAVYKRLKPVEIFNRDAIELILMKDTKDTFMYFDPPYADSDCGHYSKLKDEFYRLLEILPGLKCKWLLSSYPNEKLNKIRKKLKLNSKDSDHNLHIDAKANAGRRKTECLTWNYSLNGTQNSLFN